MEPTSDETLQNEKLKMTTINELKKVENEIRLILSEKTF
jgi:hypothetical protein